MNLPKNEFEKRFIEVTERALQHGWEFWDCQLNISLVSFKKLIDGNWARINVYLTKMTVGTYLTHPKKGKTQLFRKNVGLKLLGKIFKNPRIHTKKGYATK